MRSEPIIVNRAMIAVILGAIAVLGFSTAAYMESTGASSIPPSNVSATTYNGTTGLDLSTQISSSQINQGENITITVTVMNTLFMWNDLPPQYNFPHFDSPYVFSMSPCASVHYGVAILSGNYSASDFGKGTPLTIQEPAVYECPALYHIGYYQFLPHSSQARLYGSSAETNYLDTTELSGTLNISGFWTGTAQEPAFHAFAPGTYTIVSADEWGDVGILHFTVA